MASSSIPSNHKSFKYDVFLSFRGEDTRKSFVDHLYYALKQKGIHTYKDDQKIEKGKRINDALLKSIEESKFYIIVFSKTYASSSWCLDELVKIMECQKTTEQTAYPVFYDVEPFEVRKQSGEFGKAFAKHEKGEAARKWSKALEEAANLAGWELKNTVDGHEAQFIQKIVEEISLELRSINFSVDGKLIGMEARIRDIVSSLEIGLDDVRMVGIKGMGGGGKTTLARAVFDQISIWFEGKSFVDNVREVSKASLSGLKSLQKQVLSDVLNDQAITVSSVYDGKKMMKKMMCGRKVLVVLDDVDHIDQLEALAGESDWFKSGSRIIVTTRDEQVLIAHKVNSIRDVNFLSHKEAICLFSRYAFGREIPIQGYEELSRQVVRYAAGLPLTIRVLGSFLCGKNQHEWKDALERLKTIPLKETLEKLELSYIGLEEDYKEIFLDVACILKGWRKDEAIRVLESCGFHATSGLRVLEQKSLITISISNNDEYLGMHDHIEEMGRNIVRRLHPDEPNRHSRLWISEEIEDILANDLGTKETRCIKLMYTWKLDVEIIMKGLGNMKKLRFLQISYHCLRSNQELDEVSQHFPDSLRYLSWQNYPFRSLPKTFQANNLVTLQIPNSEIIQLWEGGEGKVLNKLRFLVLDHSKLNTLNLGMAPNLETLSLVQCVDLVEIHMPVKCLKLISINLDYSKLETLDLGLTPNLKKLSLEGCYDLVELHMPLGCLNLESINIMGAKLRTLDLRQTPNLETLSLVQCDDLVELHMPIERLKLKSIYLRLPKLRTIDLGGTSNLETLTLESCYNLVVFNMLVESLKLRSLHLSHSKLSTLDLKLNPNLENLMLSRCYDLVELHMPVECLKLKSLHIRGSKLRTLNIGRTPDLEKLSLIECVDLEEISMPVESPQLRSFRLIRSKLRTLDLGLNPNFVNVMLSECYDLVELHMPVGCLKLKSLEIIGSKLRTLNIGQTPNLEKLNLVECVDLVELHTPVEYLKLKCLHLSHSQLRTFDLGLAPNLEMFSLEGCYDLVELHIPVGCLKLESLDIRGSKLRTLDVGRTLNLKTLTLENCSDLVEFHMPAECLNLRSLRLSHSKLRTFDLGLTPNLEALSLENCDDLVKLHIPVGFLKLKSLDITGSKLRSLDLGLIPNLEALTLEGCYDLLELRMLVGCLKLRSLNLSYSKLRTLDLAMTPNLELLSLTECYHLIELHAPVGCLEKLSKLELSGCLRFKSFSFRKRFESLNIGFSSKLHLIAESLDICTLHSDSDLPKFRFTCFYEEHGRRSSIGNLEKLISVGLCTCTNVESFSRNICALRCLRKLTLEGGILEAPKDLDRLECLEVLCLSSTKITHLPDSICMLIHLKSLKLKSCWLLERLPEDLGRLECLEKLILSECIFLRDIPNSICKMKRLKYFHLPYCVLVEKLPEELGSLKCLKDLNIEGTGISHLPQSIFLLKGLRIVGSRWLLQSCGFTSGIPTSKHVSFCYI